MEKCKWNYLRFGYYFQFTETNKFKVIGKNKENQWSEKLVISFNWL